jgi:hypothetical protein
MPTIEWLALDWNDWERVADDPVERLETVKPWASANAVRRQVSR